MTGALLSSYSCEGEDNFIYQLTFDSGSSALYCLESCSKRLLKLSVSDSKLNFIDFITLPSSGLSMTACENGVLVLVDSESQPVQFISHTDETKPELTAGLRFVNKHVGEYWSLFSGCLNARREHFASLSKITLDNIEAQMEKKSKRSALLNEDPQTNAAKISAH